MSGILICPKTMSNGCILFSVSILNYEGNIIFRVGSVFVAKLAQSSHGAKYQHHALPKVSPLRNAYLLFFIYVADLISHRRHYQICRCHKAKLLSMSEVSKNREGSVEEGEGALPFWSTLLQKLN